MRFRFNRTALLYGDFMNKRLITEDRHAVDLLLSRPEPNSAKPLVEMVFARPMKSSFESRLNAVEKVLSLLDNLPAPEPAADLVARTMDRITTAQLEPTAAHRPKRTASRGAARHA